MIGIVKLFPIEAFLTRELQLFVWNERLNSICIRVLLQKKRGELVMNEVFTKRLCVEAKRSQWNVMSATLNPALTALKVMTREKCVWVKKWKIGELCMFFVRCQWKRGADSKKTKKLGNRIKNTTFCLREIPDDLVIWYSHPYLSTFFHEYRPPPACKLK